jgi:dTMP kinase
VAGVPLITFEGIEGCGKTTQARLAAEHFRRSGRQIRLEREPGGTSIGGRIRAILLDPSAKDLEPLVELLLIEADRRQHVAEVLGPALRRGEIVFCDRFNDATFAYQGGGRGLPRELIAELDRQSVDGLSPDLTLLFDCPVETGLARAHRRDSGRSGRFENEDPAFHERVRAAYLEIARENPGRVRVIDSARPEGEVSADVLHHLGEAGL